MDWKLQTEKGNCKALCATAQTQKEIAKVKHQADKVELICFFIWLYSVKGKRSSLSVKYYEYNS